MLMDFTKGYHNLWSPPIPGIGSFGVGSDALRVRDAARPHLHAAFPRRPALVEGDDGGWTVENGGLEWFGMAGREIFGGQPNH